MEAACEAAEQAAMAAAVVAEALDDLGQLFAEVNAIQAALHSSECEARAALVDSSGRVRWALGGSLATPRRQCVMLQDMAIQADRQRLGSDAKAMLRSGHPGRAGPK